MLAEQLGKIRREELRERHRNAQAIRHELDHVVHRPGPRIGRVDVLLEILEDDLLAVVEQAPLAAFAQIDVDAQVVGTLQHDLARRAELERLPVGLHDVPGDLAAEAEALGRDDALGHPLHDLRRVRIDLRRRRGGRSLLRRRFRSATRRDRAQRPERERENRRAASRVRRLLPRLMLLLLARTSDRAISEREARANRCYGVGTTR